MREKELFDAYDADDDWDVEDEIQPGPIEIAEVVYRQSRHQCPGDGSRGCGVTIPIARARCYFCTKTMWLRLGIT